MLTERQMLGSAVLAILVAIGGAIADIKAVTLIAVIWFGATMFLAQRGREEPATVESPALDPRTPHHTA